MSWVAASPNVCDVGNWHRPWYYHPDCFWNRPLVGSKQLNTDQSMAASVANLANYGRQSSYTFQGYSGIGYGAANYPWSAGFNIDEYTYPVYVVDNTTPTQKIGLWLTGPPDNPIGNSGGYDNLQSVLLEVPIPDKTQCPYITGTGIYQDVWSYGEGGMVVYNKDTGECWDLYGVTNNGPADMQIAMSCTWLCRGGGYTSDVSTFAGVYPFNQWGDRASGFGALGGLITLQDLRDVYNGGRINHAIAFAFRQNAGPNTQILPANRSDGLGVNKTATIPTGYPGAGGANPAYGRDVAAEGLCLTFPDNVDLSGCTWPVALAIAEAIRDYGMYDSDTTQGFGLYIEDRRTLGSPYNMNGSSADDPLSYANWPGGDAIEPGPGNKGNGYTVLTQLPWDQLQVVEPVSS